jgi:hypothetical protein
MGTPVSPILTRAENGKDKWKVQRKKKFWVIGSTAESKLCQHQKSIHLLKNNDRIYKKKGCNSLHFQINASSNDLSVHNSTRKMKESMQCEFG